MDSKTFKRIRKWAKLGVKNVISLLTDYYVFGLLQREIAEKYGIKQPSVSYIANKYYKYALKIYEVCNAKYSNVEDLSKCFMAKIKPIVIRTYHQKRKKRKAKAKAEAKPTTTKPTVKKPTIAVKKPIVKTKLKKG